MMAALEERKTKDRLHGQKTLKVSGFLEEFEKDDVKKNIDIIELFESFGVKLNQKGKSFMGLCPFHEDHNPSLSVDREKGLYNCFGCGESGDIFSLVEKMKGLGFKEALNYLKGFKPALRYTPPLKEERGTQGPVHENVISLNTITDYYHKRFYEHPEAVEYLRKRGLVTPELYERFQVGFSGDASHGSLLSIIGENQKAELKENGILNNSLKEHFLNCVVFPIIDDNLQVVGIYGRDISETSTFKHRYLKGNHHRTSRVEPGPSGEKPVRCGAGRGIFNRKASKVYDEIVLTESIIDALSLILVGIENVQAIYGTNGFTEEHLQTLKEDRVKTIVLALDNDEAGKHAAEKLKERLVSEGFKVKMVFPWNAKDWNEILISGKLNREDLKVLIEGTAVFQEVHLEARLEARLEEENVSSAKGFEVREEKGQTYFTEAGLFGEISYRLTGAGNSYSSSKVIIKAALRQAQGPGEGYFLDSVDLCSYRSRQMFSNHIAEKFNIEAKRVEKDLLSIQEYLEARRNKMNLREGETKIEMTEEEKRVGLEFLRSPDLFKQIVEDMNVLGYVGEDLNKQLLYLCASSRKLDDPMSVLIVSQSASGKSFLVDTVKKLVPEEDVVSVTSLSDQALNYVNGLENKFLVFGEAVHSDVIEHQIREMLSSKELSRLVALKDDKTGELVSKLVKKKVIVSSVISTTSSAINPENASRYFIINADESAEQTKRIHDSQKKKYTLERFYEKESVVPEVIKKHHAAQRLLRKRVIVNPLAKHIEFPDSLMRLRRDHDRFLDLIACVCFLRQYQKKVISNNGRNSISGDSILRDSIPGEYIECDYEDCAIALDIVKNGALSATLDEFPKSLYRFYEEFRTLAKEKAKNRDLKAAESEICQREIRKKADWIGRESVKKYLRILGQYEYISVKRGGARGQRMVYSLIVDEPLDRIDISMIPTVEEIRRRAEAESRLRDESPR